jgi:hypothetical protein
MGQVHTVQLYNAGKELVGEIAVPHRDTGKEMTWQCTLCDEGGTVSTDLRWPQAADAIDHHMNENHPHLTKP